MANGKYEDISKLGICNRRPDLYKLLEKIGARPSGYAEIEIKKIKRDQGIYPREQTDWDRVEIYQESLEEGAIFPPVLVAAEPENLLLDGNHRLAAHEQAGHEKIWIERWDIPKHYLKLVAQAANTEYGNIDTPLTGKEKKRAIIQDWEDGIRDVNLIAEALKTTPSYVRKVLSQAGLIKDRKEEMKKKARELKEQGLSSRQIAERLSEEFGERIPDRTVRDWLADSYLSNKSPTANQKDVTNFTQVMNVTTTDTPTVRSTLDDPEKLVREEEQELLEAEEETYAKFEDTDIPLATIEYWVGECRAYVETGSDPKEAVELAGVPENLRKFVVRKLVGYKNHLYQEEEARLRAELGPVDSRRREIILKAHQLVNIIQEIEQKLNDLDAVYLREEEGTPEANMYGRDQHIRNHLMFILIRGGWEKAEWFREITRIYLKYLIHPAEIDEFLEEMKEAAKKTPQQYEEEARQFWEENLATEAELKWKQFCESLNLPILKEWGGTE